MPRGSRFSALETQLHSLCMSVCCLVEKALPATDGHGKSLRKRRTPAASGKGSPKLEGHIRGVEEILLQEKCLPALLEPGSPDWLPGDERFWPMLKAIKGHCQICLASQFMFLRGW